MHTKKRANRIMTLLQKSNGIRNDLKRASTGTSCESSISVHPTALNIRTLPLSITITQKESPVLQMRTFYESARNSCSIPRIDLNLFDEPASDMPTLSKRGITLDRNEVNGSRPFSAGCKAFFYQTTKFTSNSFRGRRNSAETGNFVVSGFSFAKKRMGNIKHGSSGRKWVLYRGRSLFN